MLLSATAIVAIGTWVVDPSRVWLLGVPASFLLAAYGGGTLALAALGRVDNLRRHPVMDLAVRLQVGIALFAWTAILSGLAGIFWLAGLLGLAGSAVGCFLMARGILQLRASQELLMPIGAGLAMGTAWLVAWLWATIPPTFYDELVYHLVIPQRALATGGLLTTPWVFYTLMPHASDLLLAWGMASAGDLGGRATHFALWVACVLSVWGFAEAIGGRRLAAWAALLVVGALAASPTVWFLATLPYAETALTAAVITALAILAWPESQPRSWVPLGLILGLVASVKLSGLFWVGGILAAGIMLQWPTKDLARASLIALATVAPWWARAVALTGNPIYPLAYNVLGGNPWSPESQALLLGDLPYGRGGLDWLSLLRLPLDLVQHPERFGSAGDQGPLAVIAVCGVLALPVLSRLSGFSEKERRLGDAAAIFVLFTGTAWILSSPTTRFFAPALVLSMTIFAGAALHVAEPRRALIAIAVLVAGLWGTGRFIEQHADVFSSYEVALGRESADDYLARELDHAGAARFVREKLPPDARLLFIGETRPYYFQRAALAPSAYDSHPLRQWVRESDSAEALAARLASEGISHVVLNAGEFKRLHDHYGQLAFSGPDGEQLTRRLKTLPRALRLLYSRHGVYVFEVPRVRREDP